MFSYERKMSKYYGIIMFNSLFTRLVTILLFNNKKSFSNKNFVVLLSLIIEFIQ